MPLLNSITTPYAEAFLQVADSRQEVDQVVDQNHQGSNASGQHP